MTGLPKVLAVSVFLFVISLLGRAEETMAQEATLRIKARVLAKSLFFPNGQCPPEQGCGFAVLT
jgi:hypothetical protein